MMKPRPLFSSLKVSLLALTLLGVVSVIGQEQRQLAVIHGSVIDALTNQAIEFVTVHIDGTSAAVETSGKGKYRIEVPANEKLTLVFNRLGYKEARADVSPLGPNIVHRINLELPPVESTVEVVVRENRIDNAGMVKENVEALKLLPTTSGNFESVLPHIALGTSSGTGGELSSQYNVRGGNYDENLVYVNDFEIYRPQLIRAGQQEGLTFPNIDLINNLSFSSGGFEAKYGDKLSSVLDIKYKRPDSMRASVGLSFLGGSAHLEGSVPIGNTSYKKLRYLVGARYKTTKYLLGSLDTKGEYTPNFSDIQTYITYDLSRNWQLGLIANYNRSEYQYVPTTRNTAFGLIDFTLQLFSVFEGQEVDDFTTSMTGLSMTYIPDKTRNPLYLKFLASGFASEENERFDIIGNYRLSQIETGLGSDGFGQEIAVLGTGTQHQFVRNYLQSVVANFEHKGGIELQPANPKALITQSNFVQWSVKYQREDIDDDINEWERLDSAGYSLNYDPNQVLLKSVLKTQNLLESNRYSAFVQNTFSHRREGLREWKITAGVRASYWDLNEELVISPRAQILFKPLSWAEDISFKLAGGLYHQPPFYREMRRRDGTVNTDLLSQKSAHIVGGFTWDLIGSR